MLLSLTAGLDFSAYADDLPSSGSCGENVTYTFDSSTGTLIISGTGEMTDYSNTNSPFYNQSSIKEVVVNNGVTSIGNYVFNRCSDLMSVIISNGVIKIGVWAFVGCGSLTSIKIPDSVTSIGNHAFTACTGLTSVEIGNRVASIGKNVFVSCSSLININVDGANPYYSSKDGVLFNNDKTELIKYPIGNSETSYVIPDSVTSIGDFAFYCCSSLTNITIPNSVTSIGEDAFDSCNGLTSITIPRSIINIGARAFVSCCNLTSVTIPDSVISIGDIAFNGCSCLTSITVDSGNPNYSSKDGVLFNKNKTELITYPASNSRTNYEIPDSVTSIGGCAFDDCDSLTNITIPKGVKKIALNAFEGCSNLKDIYYSGTEDDWKKISIESRNDCLTNATIHFNSSMPSEEITDGIYLFSNYTSLSLVEGDTVRIGAGVYKNGELVDKTDGISFVIENTDIAEYKRMNIVDNICYTDIKALKNGTTFIQFTDSNTGYVKRVPITVTQLGSTSYTFNNVPVLKVSESEPSCNVYNYNGMFIDGFSYSESSKTVDFDVYNTKLINGIVEVHDKNGKIVDAVIIDKMNNNNTSINEALIDNTVCVYNDAVNGNFLTYKQETGYSKNSHISIKNMPDGGYLKITNDITKSDLLFILNSVDIMLAFKGAVDKASKISYAESEELKEKIKLGIIYNAAKLELLNEVGMNGENLEKKLAKKTAKSLIFSKKHSKDFLNSLIETISDLGFDDVVLSSMKSMGYSVAENVFTTFSGVYGATLNALFAGAALGNAYEQLYDLEQCSFTNYLSFYNTNGNKISTERVSVEQNTDFDSETSLQAFELRYSGDIDEVWNSLSDKVREQCADLRDKAFVYEIKLIKNGSHIQPKGKILVTVQIDERICHLVSQICVYHKLSDGSYERLEIVKHTSNTISFYTDSFSEFVFLPLVHKSKTDSGKSSGDGKTTQTSTQKVAATTKKSAKNKKSDKVTLKLGKIKLRKTAKKTTVKATLKINGRAVKGKKVTFKVAGVKFKAKTNKKGIAKLIIKGKKLKKLRKKLKVGKKIKVKASYGGKTVTVTIKVK